MTTCSKTLWTLILIAFLAPEFSQAGLSTELSYFMGKDTSTQSADVSTTKTNSFLSILGALDSKERFFLGWGLLSVSAIDSNANRNTYSSSDTGPYLLYFLDKDKFYSLGLNYNVQAAGSYNDGTSKTWKGTSQLMSIGITPNLKKNFFFGARLNFYSATYTQETIGSTVSIVSINRSQTYPSLVLMWNSL